MLVYRGCTPALTSPTKYHSTEAMYRNRESFDRISSQTLLLLDTASREKNCKIYSHIEL